MIDFGKQKEVPIRDLIRELLEFIDDVIDELGSRKEIEHIHTILERGSSADEQLRVFQETGDLNAVVDRLIDLTVENIPQHVNISVGQTTTAPSSIAK
jgi:carboxylate-amine ligase